MTIALSEAHAVNSRIWPEHVAVVKKVGYAERRVWQDT